MITVKEIAQMCNVSASTVSNILNGKPNVGEDTRRRVLEVVAQTGYQPNYFAQSMRKQSNRMISIIVEDLDEFSTAPIVESAMAYCDDMGYRAILMNLRLYDKWKATWYDDDEKVKQVLKPVIQELQSIRVDGIIYIAGHCRYIDYFPENFKIPTVLAYGLSKDTRYPSVVIDDEKGGYDMAKYLLSMGHKAIGVIGGADDNLHTQARLAGFKKALAEESLSFDNDNLRYGEWNRESGYREAPYLLEKDITAIFCMNDSMAAGVYDFMYEKGMTVGKEFSVVGYDNKDLSDYLRPRLTTNELPLKRIGNKAAEILLEILESGEGLSQVADVIKIPCEMIYRESVLKV